VVGVAVVLAGIAGAVALFAAPLFSSPSAKPDGSKARDEVQSWYAARAPRFRVAACEWVPGDSESNVYDCRLAAPCRASVQFYVPRAGVPSRTDADARPAVSHPLSLACRAAQARAAA